MKEFGGVLEVSHVFNTETGGDFHVPTEDNRTTIGQVIAQNAAEVVSDETFGEIIMKAHVQTSDWIKATYEMLTDSGYDLEAYIKGRIAERIWRKLNKLFTTGAGTTEPYGAVTQSTLGKTTAGVAAVTRAEILGLIHSVDPAYRKSKACKIMTNDSTVLAIKLLTVGSGDDRPLWQPSIIQGAPDKLEGFDIVINQDMASMATGNKFMLFGDFSKFWIRKVSDIQLQVSAEKYIDNRAMAYKGFTRYDSALVDTNAIKHMKNA
jgi:HK97 family phage major capsid protein